jgi:polyhydroxyalkanoate synthesis regulator phasin
MVEESGVESSLTDEEIRQYLDEVIKEIKKAKVKLSHEILRGFKTLFFDYMKTLPHTS